MGMKPNDTKYLKFLFIKRAQYIILDLFCKNHLSIVTLGYLSFFLIFLFFFFEGGHLEKLKLICLFKQEKGCLRECSPLS